MRLFVNLLEYEMGIAIFLCRFNIPVNGHGLALYWCAIDFGDRDASGTQRYNFALIHDENMAGVFEKCGGRNEQTNLSPPNTPKEMCPPPQNAQTTTMRSISNNCAPRHACSENR